MARIGTGAGVVFKNFGTVLSAGSATVSFSSGGSVYNSGGISGGSYGVRVSGCAGTVNNQGSIGSSTAGIALLAGGSLYNGGTVTGANGVVLGSGGGTVANYGRITGTGSGVLLQAGGDVRNRVSGTISGVVGVLQTAAGAATVSNTGNISGTTDSVLLHAGAANRVIIYQGAQFHGVVDGGNPIGGGAVSTLELASSSTPGVLTGLGSQYIDFAQITVDPGADWSLGGTNTIVSGATLSLDDTTLTDSGTQVNNGVITLNPSDMTVGAPIGNGNVTISAGSTLEVQGTISSGETIVFAGTGVSLLTLDDPDSAAGGVTQLAAGDYIDLRGIDPASVTFSGGKIDFTDGSFPLSLAAGSTFEPAFSDGDDGAVVGAICFCTGAGIATPSGEVPVERLAVGDMVLTADGAVRPIVWTGVGHALAVRGRRGPTTPVIVRKGALADNVPHRDLRVTKGHSLLLDGVLIPVEFLVNHRSIMWDDRAQRVTIHHIELATHDVLLANGAPAESYRDDGNRRLFQNANSGWDLPPRAPCAPVLTGVPEVDAIGDAWRIVPASGLACR
jgi:Hint domain